MIRPPPTSTLFPYTPLFRSGEVSLARIDVWDGQEPPLILCESRSLTGWANMLSCPRTNSARSEEHTSELQSRQYLVCRLLLEKKKHTSPPSRPQAAARGRPI